ncbi:MAG: GlcG/HbpS family heme-binding protein [Terracidiphilus sp.]
MPRVAAQLLVDASQAAAVRLGVPMAIAVADAEGGQQLFARMDGALPVSSELAVSKAYTAAVLRMSSAEVGRLAQPGAPLYGIESTHNGKIVLFGGGLPLFLNGEVAGAIGVSGGSVEEDVMVATPAVELLQTMEHWAEKIRVQLPKLEVKPLDLELAGESLGDSLEQMVPRPYRAEAAILAGAICLALSQLC